MLIFYIDESGDTCMDPALLGQGGVFKQGVSDWFVLAAVGIPETSRGDLAEDIGQIKDAHFPGWKTRPWEDTEIKGNYLRLAHRRLSYGLRPAKPRGYSHLTQIQFGTLCGALASLFKKFRPQIYVIAVDKVALAPRRTPWPPEAITYAFLQQRMALLVDHVFGDAEGVLMLADEQQEHENLFKTGEMLRIRTQVTTGLPVQPRFELILDRPIWIDSTLHPLDREILQLPDIVAHTVYRLLKLSAISTDPSGMWPEISMCLATHWSTGLVPDAGLAIYPRPANYPPGV